MEVKMDKNIQMQIIERTLKHLKKNDDIIYHYCPIDTLWKILDSDSLLARQVRFSNDSYEYHLGNRVAKLIIKEHYKNVDNMNIKEADCYMLCFCKERNKLSQWREYAKLGVSIGFDIRRPSVFSLLNFDDEENYFVLPNRPCKVIYFNYPHNAEAEDDKWLSDDEKNILKKFTDNREKKFNVLMESIPFFKHSGFREEDEYRIIFTNKNNKFKDYINYFESNNKRIPYLTIQFGDKGLKQRSKSVVCINKEDKKLLKELNDNGITCHVCNNKIEDYNNRCCYDSNRSCLECNMNMIEKIDIVTLMITNGENQEDIFNKVDKIVELKYSNKIIKIWCEGHLPIRSIMVGPSTNQSDIAESIRHYKRNFYWMKYVDVDFCNIPYRSPRLE